VTWWVISLIAGLACIALIFLDFNFCFVFVFIHFFIYFFIYFYLSLFIFACVFFIYFICASFVMPVFRTDNS